MVFRLNQLGHTVGEKEFWQAQSDVTLLRNKLQSAYVSAMQKAKIQKAKQGQSVPDIWMFGAVAYQFITEDGLRLKDVLEMSGAKLARLAQTEGEKFKAKAAAEGDSAYMIDKKSKE